MSMGKISNLPESIKNESMILKRGEEGIIAHGSDQAQTGSDIAETGKAGGEICQQITLVQGVNKVPPRSKRK